ncbi:hypothetical protein F4778DRAFT_782365 [Xylariomycetidae sp. FL2044]|nr:hypothetical protein F4778DRAFT_782365 [Xylariomycetidae sp. FL2044]
MVAKDPTWKNVLPGQSVLQRADMRRRRLLVENGVQVLGDPVLDAGIRRWQHDGEDGRMRSGISAREVEEKHVAVDLGFRQPIPDFLRVTSSSEGRHEGETEDQQLLPDLHTVPDFCDHFEHHQDSWLPRTPVLQALPRPITLHLAGSLASLVLQYHSTPWLPDQWESSDVCFAGLEALDPYAIEPPNSIPAFVGVCFSKSLRSKGKAVAGSSSELIGTAYRNRGALGCAVMETGHVRNVSLFCLGIALLELGYSRPWGALRDSIMGGSPCPETDRLLCG